MGKVKLSVLGLSYSQTQSGAYALVLAEEGGSRRIPIIVGGFEAQSIAIELEGLNPPRPLTHDLFKSFAQSYGIKLVEVNIHKLEEGVFYASVLFDNGDRQIQLDARTSDAVALAIRFKCPIYTTTEIVDKAGIVLDFEKDKDEADLMPGTVETILQEEPSVDAGQKVDLSDKSSEELEHLLNDAVGNENYETASLIRDEIERRKKS